MEYRLLAIGSVDIVLDVTRVPVESVSWWLAIYSTTSEQTKYMAELATGVGVLCVGWYIVKTMN